MKMHFFLPAGLLLLMTGIICPGISYSQNVGIGTPAPQKLLSVNGSMLIDQGNTNFGTLDSAALLLGTLGGVGISSQKTDGDLEQGLSIWTNNIPRLNIKNNGMVGIGTTDPTSSLHVIGTIFATSSLIAPTANITTRLGINGGGNPAYRLQVNNGDSYFEGKGTFMEAVGIGGINNTGHKLFVNGTSQFNSAVNIAGILNGGTAGFTNHIVVGTYANIGTNATIGNNLNVANDGIIDGNFRVNGRVGINGPTQSEFKLIVNGGNSYFQGNITASGNANVLGTLNATGDLTIKGNGHVRSNGPSNLRVGFDSRSINLTLAGGAIIDLTTNITHFEGGNPDIRVSIAQFDPDPAPQYANWTYFDFKIYDVDPVTDQCRVRISNRSAASQNLKGVLYLTSIVRE